MLKNSPSNIKMQPGESLYHRRSHWIVEICAYPERENVLDQGWEPWGAYSDRETAALALMQIRDLRYFLPQQNKS